MNYAPPLFANPLPAYGGAYATAFQPQSVANHGYNNPAVRIGQHFLPLRVAPGYGYHQAYVPAQTAVMPQGFFGDLIGQGASAVGSMIGNMIVPGLGGQIGGAIGNAVGGIGQQLIPFSVAPGYGYQPVSQTVYSPVAATVTPQGFFGDLIGQGASAVGSMIGNMIVPGFGGQIGGAIGNAAGGIAQQLIPFSVAPGYGYQPVSQAVYSPVAATVTPQGFFGDLIGQGASAVGSMIGNMIVPGFGGQIGGAIGNAAGGIAQQLIPFSVAPGYGYQPVSQAVYSPVAATVTPQGFFGDLIGQGASAVGSMIGNMIVPGFGGQIGGAIGNAAGGIAQQLIPFSVAPGYGYQQAYVPSQSAVMPQGFFGDLVGQGAPVIGSMIGNHFAPGIGGQIGGAIGNAVGGIGQQLIPFSVAPAYGYQQAYAPAQAAVMPQGFFGDLIGQGASAVGSMIGNMIVPGFGGQIGGAIGNAAGGIAQQLIPFSVAPGYGYQPVSYYNPELAQGDALQMAGNSMQKIAKALPVIVNVGGIPPLVQWYINALGGSNPPPPPPSQNSNTSTQMKSLALQSLGLGDAKWGNASQGSTFARSRLSI